MSSTLGIAVTTRDSAAHVLGVAEAARRAGIRTDIFLTGDGVHLAHHPRFPELLEAGRVGVCEVSYIARGYRGRPVDGLTDKDFVTQERNAELVERSDRYLVL